MSRRIALVTVLFALLAAFHMPTDAASVDESIIWLTGEGQALGLSVTGEIVATYDLPQSPASTPQQKAFMLSYSGRYGAFINTRPDDNSTWLFTVYDLKENRLAVQYESQAQIWEALNFRPGPAYFDQAETRVTLGFNAYSSEPFQIGPWHYIVFDLKTGKILNELSPSSDDSVPGCISCTPFTNRFVDDQIDFALTRLGTEDYFRPYSWNLISGEVLPVENSIGEDYWGFESDIFWQSGEIVWPRRTNTLAVQEIIGEQFIPPPNTLTIYEPDKGISFPIYHTVSGYTHYPHFIQNGERILFWTFSQETQSYSPRVLNRDGTLANIVLPAFDKFVYDLILMGTADGFVYMPLIEEDYLTTTLMVVNTRNGGSTGETIWQDNNKWHLLHVQNPLNATPLSDWTPLPTG